MAQKGRPITKPTKLKSGFYVELSNKGAGRVKLRKDNMREVERVMKQYEGVKEVVFLGEKKDGVWLSGKNKGKKED
ncbi:MAG: hypothetical protein JXR07_04485 [Reichenbachiella sp.]